MAKGLKHIIKTTYSYMLGRVVERTLSDVSTCLEVTHMNGKFMLNSIHANYSYGALQKVFETEFRNVDLGSRKINDVLILGFGAGSVTETLLEKYKFNCNIIGVELDEKVILLGMKYFDIARFNNTEIICKDAYDYVMECNKHFDLIIIDVYIDETVPPKFESEKFLSKVKNLVTPDGLIIFNKMICDEDTERSSKKLYETFGNVMGNFTYHKVMRHNTNLMLVYDPQAKLQKQVSPENFHPI